MAERRYKAKREDFGTIRVRSSGRFQASYLGPDGVRYNAPMTYSTRTDARAWLSAIRTDIERGKWKSPKAASAETFGLYAATWVDQRTSSKGEALRPKTRAEYRRQLDKGLSEFAVDQLTAITAARVRTWHAARSKAGKSTAGAESRLLRAILSTAVEDGIIVTNPVPSKLTKAKAGKSYRPPTVAELAVLIHEIDDRYRLALYIAAYAGLRLSEWRALRRSDLALVGGQYFVNVSRQAQFITGQGWVIGAPKSERGIRAAILPTWLTEAVEAHLEAHVGEFPESLLFAPRRGSEFIHNSDFYKAWNVARDAAGVRGEVREHDLRGFSSSHMVDTAGGSLLEARDHLGHASVRTTEAFYMHRITDRRAELADRMPKLPAVASKKSTPIIHLPTQRGLDLNSPSHTR